MANDAQRVTHHPVDCAIVVMGKLPVPGRVKTRLQSRHTPQEACELYKAFLQDVISGVDLATENIGVKKIFAYAAQASEDISELQALIPDTWQLLAQQGDDLGERIEFVRQSAQASHVIILGSDAPNLPPSRIQEAINILSSNEQLSVPKAVFGPTEDGGYYLIGLSKAEPALLTDISWSTSEVLNQTKEAARKAGIAIELLESWRDIDEPEDLDWLASQSSVPLYSKVALTKLGYR